MHPGKQRPETVSKENFFFLLIEKYFFLTYFLIGGYPISVVFHAFNSPMPLTFFYCAGGANGKYPSGKNPFGKYPRGKYTGPEISLESGFSFSKFFASFGNLISEYLSIISIAQVRSAKVSSLGLSLNIPVAISIYFTLIYFHATDTQNNWN
jgi:hypothetical protein